MLAGCKISILKFLMTLAHTCNLGSDGRIANWSIFEGATRDVSVVRCPNCRRHSTKHTNGRCEKSTKQTGNLRTDCFNVLPSLPAHSASMNWQSSSHSISSRDRSQSSTRDGASKTLWMPCYLHVQHYLPWSTSMARRS